MEPFGVTLLELTYKLYFRIMQYMLECQGPLIATFFAIVRATLEQVNTVL